MFKRILIATDGSEYSRKAAKQAVGLAKECDARLVAMTAEAPFPVYLFPPNVVDDVEQAMERHGREILAEVEHMAAAASVPCSTKCVLREAAHRAILAMADAEACDLIVMGSHGRSGFVALALGSVTQKVLAQAKVPVLVTR